MDTWLHGLLDAVDDALLVADESGRLVVANEAMADMLGYDRGELLALRLSDITSSSELFQREPARFRAAEPWHGEIELRHKDGTTLTRELRAFTIPFGAGMRHLAIIRDSGAGGSAARALQESEERFRALADATFEGIVIHERGQHIIANQAFARMLGYAPEEVAGKTSFDFVAPESHEIMRQHMRERSEEPYEAVGIRKDGSRFPVEILGKQIQFQGRPARVVAIRDLTERKRAEQALTFLASASETLASSLDYETTLAQVARLSVEHLADYCLVDVFDEGGLPRRLAAAHRDPQKERFALELTRYSPSLEGGGYISAVLRTGKSTLVSSVTPDDSEAAARDAEHLRLIRALEPKSYMVVPLLARERVLGSILFASCDEHRQYRADDLAIAEDLARRCALAIDNARLYREAQAAIGARDEFLSIASHELRTPLSGLKGAAQLALRRLARGDVEPERLRVALESVDETTDRLALLTRDLLDVSRIRTGRLTLEPRRLDLAALVRDWGQRIVQQIDDRHPLEIETPAGPCWTVADPARLEQVLTNLIDNAVKYSPDGGTIRLSVQADSRGVHIRVQDHGIGIPDDARESIFEPFGRAPNAKQRRTVGMGLGLYICRNIIEQMDGWIRAESAGEGAGATIDLWLPAADLASASLA